MKRIILLCVLCAALLTSRAQIPQEWNHRWWEAYLEEALLPLNLSMQNVIGDWHRENEQSALQAVDVISQMTGMSGDDLLHELYPVLYSPLQSSEAMQPTEHSFSGDTLIFVQASLGLRMTLVYDPADSTFSGTFRQGMMRTNITFRPCDTLSTFPRPQTPQQPYSFLPEQVTIRHKDKTGRPVELAGTLAIPKGEVPKAGFPCVVLLTGSGTQNRDEELFLHKPFLVWAEYLAQRGIATLRCDDRGIGQSKGEVLSATTYDLADDAEAMLDFLSKRNKINPKRLALMGHSEGGAIAPMVAARNRKVAAVVMLAGQGCTGAEVLLQQNEALFHLQGVEDSLIQVRLACMKELFSLIDTSTPENYMNDVARIIKRHVEHLSKEEQKAIDMRVANAYGWAQQLANAWLSAFIKLDPQSYLPRVKCPLMAVNGTKDCQVLAEPNLQAIQRMLPKAQIYKAEGLNHLMQHCETGHTKEYLYIEETLAPEVLEQVGDFLVKQLK